VERRSREVIDCYEERRPTGDALRDYD